jgi:hypothetical protein
MRFVSHALQTLIIPSQCVNFLPLLPCSGQNSVRKKCCFKGHLPRRGGPTSILQGVIVIPEAEAEGVGVDVWVGGCGCGLGDNASSHPYSPMLPARLTHAGSFCGTPPLASAVAPGRTLSLFRAQASCRKLRASPGP